MKYIADLHIHSYLSRATSKQLNLPHLNKWAQLKGIQMVATGDFTHPQWLAECEEMLEPVEEGLFRLRDEFKGKPEQEVLASCKSEVRFILSVEISNIYKRNGQVRKVHNVVFMPHLEAARKFQSALERIGNIRSDGRPILGLDSRDLLEIVLETDPQGYLIPAHIWTPWFSVLGSKSGFDSITECYDDLSDHIFALETGLSSDPPMNWRLSQLDRYALVSNSDAHSPANLGREANLFNTELSYPALFEALKTKNQEKYLGTIEFFPEEGKYHLDGHRKCNSRLTPEETLANNGLCPVCGKKVTVGVMHRVNALADRAEGTKPEGAAGFHSLIPLAEIIGEVQGVGPKSKTVEAIFQKMLAKLGPELDILMNIPLEEIDKMGHSLLTEAIRRARVGEVSIAGGYDGEYGTIKIFQPEERESFLSQMLFSGMNFPPPKKEKQRRSVKKAANKETGALSKKKTNTEIKNKPNSETKEKDFLSGLNEAQQAAVRHTVGPLLIIAGPGTGKTRTLTHRIAYLIREKICKPENILAITFTRHAAREMLERLNQLFDRKVTEKMTICTFHALGNLILQNEMDKLRCESEFTIYSEQDCLDLLRGLQLDLKQRELQKILEKISAAKNQLITYERSGRQHEFIFQDEFQAVFEKYEEAMRQISAVDYDDLILLPYLILKKYRQVREKYQRKFQWISVDEYQDINFAQYHFLMQLLPASQNLCAIGDPDQAIYSFRGSDVRYFQKFQKDFPRSKIIQLGQNYRSTSMILMASSQIIAKNPGDRDRKLWSEIPGNTRIEIIESPTEKAEAEFVVHNIEKMLGGTGFFSLDSSRVSADDEENAPHSFSDFAVLYRLRTQSKALEEAFLRSGMPFQTMGETPFFEQPPIKSIISYMRVLQNPNNNLDLIRILNIPSRGIGEKSVRILTEFCRQNQKSIYEGIESQDLISTLNSQVHQALRSFFELFRSLQFEMAKNSVADLIRILLDEIGIRTFYGATESNESRWELLSNYANSYNNRFSKFLSDVLLLTETDNYDPRAEKVTLMSLHASKGLEFPVVFIVGCEENLMPYLRTDTPTEQLEATIQEERRLLYVGMTRAQQRLYLIHAKKRLLFGQFYRPKPSMFLNDIESALKEMRDSLTKLKKKKKTDNQMSLF